MAMFLLGMTGVLLLVVYFLPACVALYRDHSYKWVIFAINFAAGWTALGWLVAFVWAAWPKEKAFIEPIVGNVIGTGYRTSGDALGAAAHGIERGRFEEVHPRRPYGQTASHAGITSIQIEQLERLSALHKSGVLTQAELEAQKTSILSANSLKR